MSRILYPEFHPQFAATKYPFAPGSSLVNDQGDTLLDGTFLDAHLYPIGGQEGLYLSQVVVDYATVTFGISDHLNIVLATGSMPFNALPSIVTLRDLYGRPAGILVSSPLRLSVFRAWAEGTHTFTALQTQFLATCCMPTPEIGVRGILLADGSLFTGPVWIVGDSGVVVRHEVVPQLRRGCAAQLFLQAIRVDIVGDPLYCRRLFDQPGQSLLYATPNPIRKLRIRSGARVFECTPDQYGRFTLQGNNDLARDTVLRIRTQPTGLLIEAVGSNNYPTTSN